jgi:hypothetical protein
MLSFGLCDQSDHVPSDSLVFTLAQYNLNIVLDSDFVKSDHV